MIPPPPLYLESTRCFKIYSSRTLKDEYKTRARLDSFNGKQIFIPVAKIDILTGMCQDNRTIDSLILVRLFHDLSVKEFFIPNSRLQGGVYVYNDDIKQHSGDLKTRHSKTRNICEPDFYLSSFKCTLRMTIWKHTVEANLNLYVSRDQSLKKRQVQKVVYMLNIVNMS